VIGSAGSAAKVKHVTDDLGFDAAFNYKEEPVRDALRRTAPDGIDVYFDNVGGTTWRRRSPGCSARPGRVVRRDRPVQRHGADARAAQPRAGHRQTADPARYIVTDHADRMPDFVAEMSGWLRAGEIICQETVVDASRTPRRPSSACCAGQPPARW